MTDRDATDRIERIHEAAGRPIDESDLPDGHADPVEYLTDDDGRWDHDRYARLLLEARGPATVASVALRELAEVEEAFDRFEDCARSADAEPDAELRGLPGDTGPLDREVVESIRACVAVLGESVEGSDTER